MMNTHWPGEEPVGIGPGKEGVQIVNQMDWSPEEEIPDIPPGLDQAHLDCGERDTLTLTMEMDRALVLMDEAEGREVARAQGLSVRGSLGVLIEAYRKGLLGAAQKRMSFAEIVRRQDIWVNPELAERLLHEVLED